MQLWHRILFDKKYWISAIINPHQVTLTYLNSIVKFQENFDGQIHTKMFNGLQIVVKFVGKLNQLLRKEENWMFETGLIESPQKHQETSGFQGV